MASKSYLATRSINVWTMARNCAGRDGRTHEIRAETYTIGESKMTVGLRLALRCEPRGYFWDAWPRTARDFCPIVSRVIKLSPYEQTDAPVNCIECITTEPW